MSDKAAVSDAGVGMRQPLLFWHSPEGQSPESEGDQKETAIKEEEEDWNHFQRVALKKKK